MSHKYKLATKVFIEVVGAASNSSSIDGAIVDTQRLQLPVCAKVGISREEIEARRVDAHGGGCAGSLRPHTRDSKADCTSSQYEPAKYTFRAIIHSTSSTQIAHSKEPIYGSMS